MPQDRDNLAGTVCWQSPSNIALIKYWGKHGDQLPRNPSISFTLKHSFTQTRIHYRPKTNKDQQISLNFQFEGKENKGFQDRIVQYLQKVMDYFPSLQKIHLEIDSTNSFPHSSGIASSASAFSALALSLSDIELKTSGQDSPIELFNVSEIARLGSGSACRSMFPFAALWGKFNSIESSTDRYAIPMGTEVHEIFRTFHDSILIVSRESKKVSSSLGHSLMDNHPFAEVRYRDARKNLQLMLDALKVGDIESVGFLMEMEAMQLHALMLCSNPNFILLQPNTLKIIDLLKRFRSEMKIPVFFTLDAGPNVHVLYPGENAQVVQNYIQSELLQFCSEQNWINDCVGDGPIKIE